MNELEIWLANKISFETNLPVETIDYNKKFDDYDLDSLSTVSILFDLEKEFNLEEINPSVFSEFNTINSLSAWIKGQL